jgi:Glycine zipper 2TM domain
MVIIKQRSNALCHTTNPNGVSMKTPVTVNFFKSIPIAALMVAALVSAAPAQAREGERDRAVIGAVLGAGAGALIGSQMGGRNGAIVGGALGAAVGSTIATNGHHVGPRSQAPYPSPVYAPAPVYVPTPVYAPAPVYYPVPSYQIARPAYPVHVIQNPHCRGRGHHHGPEREYEYDHRGHRG